MFYILCLKIEQIQFVWKDYKATMVCSVLIIHCHFFSFFLGWNYFKKWLSPSVSAMKHANENSIPAFLGWFGHILWYLLFCNGDYIHFSISSHKDTFFWLPRCFPFLWFREESPLHDFDVGGINNSLFFFLESWKFIGF